MKKMLQVLVAIYGLAVLTSCNSHSNALTQQNAEKGINAFLASNNLKAATVEVSPASLQKIGKTNIYSQFNTSVKADIAGRDGKPFTLLFDFTRTPKNKWFLTSVEVVDDPAPELTSWLETNKRLNIAVQ